MDTAHNVGAKNAEAHLMRADLREALRLSPNPYHVHRQVRAHLSFVINANYPRLMFAALVGRALKVPRLG